MAAVLMLMLKYSRLLRNFYFYWIQPRVFLLSDVDIQGKSHFAIFQALSVIFAVLFNSNFFASNKAGTF